MTFSTQRPSVLWPWEWERGSSSASDVFSSLKYDHMTRTNFLKKTHACCRVLREPHLLSCQLGGAVTIATTWNLSSNEPTSSCFVGWHSRVCMCCPTLRQLLLKIPPAKIILSDRRTEVTQTLWKRLLVQESAAANEMSTRLFTSYKVNFHFVIAENSETLLQYKENHAMQKSISYILLLRSFQPTASSLKRG